ncbi:MAG: NIF family HAD-type phosphatase, partial [Cyclobacteriaceae bacterium]
MLDLDETLIYYTRSPADEQWDLQVFDYKVYKRPYLIEFLTFIQQHFRVAVWSSASDDYVEGIVQAIFPENYSLEFVWGRSRCIYRL